MKGDWEGKGFPSEFWFPPKRFGLLSKGEALPAGALKVPFPAHNEALRRRKPWEAEALRWPVAEWPGPECP